MSEPIDDCHLISVGLIRTLRADFELLRSDVSHREVLRPMPGWFEPDPDDELEPDLSPLPERQIRGWLS